MGTPEPDHVPDLVHEGWISRQLERLLPVRLETKGTPNARDHGLAQAGPLGHDAGGPVRGPLGLCFQRERDQALDLVVPDLARCTGARGVHQPIQAMGREASPPGGHARARLTPSARATPVLVEPGSAQASTMRARWTRA